MRHRNYRQMMKAAGTLGVLVLALFSFNCMNAPLDPVGPTWDTQVTTPLSLRSYSVTDLTAKNPLLVLNTPGGQIPMSVILAVTGGHFSDTASMGDSSGSGKGNTLVDSSTARDFTSIKIHVMVDDAIPLNVAVKLQFLDGSKHLIMNIPQTAGDSVTVAAPVVVGGVVQAPTHAERILTLSGAEIQQFNKSQFIIYYLQVSAPGANLSAIQPTQTINIRVWAELTYQVNK